MLYVSYTVHDILPLSDTHRYATGVISLPLPTAAASTAVAARPIREERTKQAPCPADDRGAPLALRLASPPRPERAGPGGGATGTPPPRKAPRTNPPRTNPPRPRPPRTAAPLLGAMDPTPRGTTTDLQQDLKDVSHLQMIRLSQVNINIACKEMHKKSSYR